MKISLLDLKTQYMTIKDDIDMAIEKVVQSQNFILSDEVSALEKEIAEYSGSHFASGVASGTDALLLALRAVGISREDRVVTTSFSFFATSEAISILGAVPVFVDIDPDTYNIDTGKLEELMKDTRHGAGDRIKAVLPVHLYGQCADMEKITDIAEKYGLKVIEDCAQAIGATHNGKKAGSFGDAGCYSFFPSKNLGGFGDGGMVISSDRAVVEAVNKLRVHGSREQYIHEEIAYNSRLDSLQAAILRVKLRRLDGWLEGRRRVAETYNRALSGTGVKIPAVMDGNTHTYHQYTISLDDRDEFMEYMNARGIAVRVYYPVPLHLQPCYRELGYKEGDFPVAEGSSRKVVSLPVYPELTEEQKGYIINTVNDFFKR